MREPTEIYNWRRLNEQLTTSGQPSEDQLKDLKKWGVDLVINLGLHNHERALADEASSVAELGMTYVHIPVAFDNPTDADFEKFRTALRAAGDAKLHVHCIANYRVTAFLYRYQRDVLGMDDSAARSLMDTVWAPGGVWAKFIGDDASINLPHRAPPKPHQE